VENHVQTVWALCGACGNIFDANGSAGGFPMIALNIGIFVHNPSHLNGWRWARYPRLRKHGYYYYLYPLFKTG